MLWSGGYLSDIFVLCGGGYACSLGEDQLASDSDVFLPFAAFTSVALILALGYLKLDLRGS